MPIISSFEICKAIYHHGIYLIIYFSLFNVGLHVVKNWLTDVYSKYFLETDLEKVLETVPGFGL